MINFLAVLGVGLMVGRLTLNQLVGVRIPYPQLKKTASWLFFLWFDLGCSSTKGDVFNTHLLQASHQNLHRPDC